MGAHEVWIKISPVVTEKMFKGVDSGQMEDGQNESNHNSLCWALLRWANKKDNKVAGELNFKTSYIQNKHLKINFTHISP